MNFLSDNLCIITFRLLDNSQDIERVFGLLKNRWPRLKMVDVHSLELLVHIIQASVVLHNFTVMEGDHIDYFMDEENEDPVCFYPLIKSYTVDNIYSFCIKW